jgi:hypothetical protein
MKVSRKVGRRSHSTFSRRRLRNKKTKSGYRKKHTQQGGRRGRGHKRARTHKRGKRFHRGGEGPDLHRRNGGIVEIFLLNSAYLGEHELTYSNNSFFSKNITKKFHVYYQTLDHGKLYLLRIKDDKFHRFLCLDTRQNTITELENFDTGNLDKLEFESLDIETGDPKETCIFKNNQINSDSFGKILDKLHMPPVVPLIA